MAFLLFSLPITDMPSLIRSACWCFAIRTTIANSEERSASCFFAYSMLSQASYNTLTSLCRLSTLLYQVRGILIPSYPNASS
uniref:Uncharacterized protein n=1 Tax=Oryza brachyantha TaxID=4533 RepID=J3MER9_ORYBR